MSDLINKLDIIINTEIKDLIDQKEQQQKRIELLVNLVTTQNREILRLRKFAPKKYS